MLATFLPFSTGTGNFLVSEVRCKDFISQHECALILINSNVCASIGIWSPTSVLWHPNHTSRNARAPWWCSRLGLCAAKAGAQRSVAKLSVLKSPKGPHQAKNTTGSNSHYGVVSRAELKVTDARWRTPMLRFPAVFCKNLRFSVKICGFLRPPNMLEFPTEGVKLRKSAVFCENLRFWALSLLVASPSAPPESLKILFILRKWQCIGMAIVVPGTLRPYLETPNLLK